MPTTLPVLIAPFTFGARLTRAGLLVWRATCEVPTCPYHVEMADWREALREGHNHRDAHRRGGKKVFAVVVATIRRAA